MFDAELIDRLKFVVENDFVRLDYTEGIKILMESGAKFEYPVSWGLDLQSEHERYLVENISKTGYPDQLPQGDQGFLHETERRRQTVRAMDVLFPKSAKSSAVPNVRKITINCVQG